MQTTNEPLRLLIADANVNALDAARLALESFGHHVVAAATWPALEQVLSDDFDAIVSDVVMPPLVHGEIVHRIRRAHPQTALVVASSGFLLTSRPLAFAHGADIFVERPVSMEALNGAIERARHVRYSSAC